MGDADRLGSGRRVGALGTLLIAFPMYFLLQFATFPILVATMIIGGILPTMSWAALGGLMNDLFPDHFRYSALSISYAIAATVSGFVPLVTLALGEETGFAWWHPGVVLALLAAITLVSAWAASRRAAGARARHRAPSRRRRWLTRGTSRGMAAHPCRCRPGCLRRPAARLADGPAAGAGGESFQMGWTALNAEDGCRARAHHRVRHRRRIASIAST